MSFARNTASGPTGIHAWNADYLLFYMFIGKEWNE